MKFALALTAVLVLFAPPARAADATRGEVTQLARDAAFDDDSLTRLRNIDSIDGEPVDIERLISGADGTEIERVISTLFAEDLPEPRDPAADRAEAELVLEQGRYHAGDIPRPFRGPLEWIADRLEPVGDGIGEFFGWIAEIFTSLAAGTPGGATTLWTLIGLVVVVFVASQTRRIVERRGRLRASEGPVGEASRSDDPRDLERQAAAARARGDHAMEVRLLFRAGVIRLGRARVIPARHSLTTGEIRQLLHSGDFDRVGRSFDAIAYGKKPANDADGDAARAGWERVLRGVDR